MKAKKAAESICGTERFDRDKHRNKLFNIMKSEFSKRQDRNVDGKTVRDRICTNMDSLKNYISEMKDYFDAISRKVCGGLPETEWSFFYAKTIVPFRQAFFPEDARRIEEYRARKPEHSVDESIYGL